MVWDLKVTYHGTVIGYGWTMLEPLLLTAVYWAVFALLRATRTRFCWKSSRRAGLRPFFKDPLQPRPALSGTLD